MDAEKALDLAARMEAFVTQDRQSTLLKEKHPHRVAQNTPTQLPAAPAETIIVISTKAFLPRRRHLQLR
jgi:hypothetical protein